ncbi:MAG: hypothetical protein M0R06_12265 [Sphaerochaeta sp.]|jgi:hypothetical protein|nr:hypothetical protein [Sphaerochaeta sp.]
MLKFYYNGCDAVIANSTKDAAAILCDTYGPIEEEAMEFEELGKYGTNVVSLLFIDDAPEESEVPKEGWVERCYGGWIVFATVDQWIAHCGRGYFGSEEW